MMMWWNTSYAIGFRYVVLLSMIPESKFANPVAKVFNWLWKLCRKNKSRVHLKNINLAKKKETGVIINHKPGVNYILRLKQADCGVYNPPH